LVTARRGGDVYEDVSCLAVAHRMVLEEGNCQDLSTASLWYTSKNRIHHFLDLVFNVYESCF
jgi:hypothetical protein